MADLSVDAPFNAIFQGDRPIWLTLLGTPPAAGLVLAVEMAWSGAAPALSLSTLLFPLCGGLLLMIALMAGLAVLARVAAIGAVWRLTLAGDPAAEPTPDPAAG